MAGAVTGAVGRLRARIEAQQTALGLAYPWWLPILSFNGTAVCVVVGLVQRDALVPPRPVVLGGLVVLAPGIYHLTRRSLACWLHSTLVIGAMAWVLAVPTAGSPGIDFAPAVLAFLAAEVTAKAPRAGVVASAASAALLFVTAAVASLPNLWANLLELLLGAHIGYVLHFQMRALVAERVSRAGERERATLAERTRIAREVHDLTAHSLTITLLHLTGARRLLQEGDTTEAASALADAEDAGRRAMTDIRRTVGSRTAVDDATSPLPTAGDLTGLVEEVRRAGLQVEYDGGRVPPVDDSVGLGLYRILQESLANVARHAPGSVARVSVSHSDGALRACVRNRLNGSARVARGTGSGLAGMAARAEQLGGTLSAGERSGDWVVDLVLPAGVA